MLQLTVREGQKSTVHTFDQDLVTVGSKGDLALQIPDLQEKHLEISKKEDVFWVCNVANDPFVSLNGVPFGKKPIQSGDCIEVAGIEMEVLIQQEAEEPLAIDRLLEEVDQLEEEFSPPLAPKALFNELVHSAERDWECSFGWRAVIGGVLAALLLLTVSSALLYLRVETRRAYAESEIAVALSDVAMALSYAKVNQLNPPKRDFSHPSFLEKNLTHLLPSGRYPFAQIDAQGRFMGKSYFLRIYTEPELSRFLVIAQPFSSFFQWMVPNGAIVIDSALMELRKVRDLKTLNRLLANPRPLRGGNGILIGDLVEQGSPISMHSLGQVVNGADFTVPEGVISTARQKLYNAPRYYRLGESLITFLRSLESGVATTHDMVLLQQLIENLEGFDHFILYTPGGQEEANRLKSQLSLFAPQLAASIAYLEKENAQGSELLAATDLAGNDQELVVCQEPFPDHPIALQLRALRLERKVALDSLKQQIIDLLSSHTEAPLPNFFSRLGELIGEYRMKERELNQLLAQRFEELYQEDSSLSPDQFVAFVDKASLSSALAALPPPKNASAVSKRVEEALLAVESADSLPELEERLKKAIDLFSFRQAVDLERLVLFQHATRSATLYALKRLLLSPGYLKAEATQRERALLLNVLSSARIQDPEEVAYFLDEYDVLCQGRV